MWRTPVGYPNVYMTAAAYYDGPKIDPTFICFMLFIISDVYTAIFLMAFAVMTSTLSDSLGGNPDIYLIPRKSTIINFKHKKITLLLEHTVIRDTNHFTS